MTISAAPNTQKDVGLSPQKRYRAEGTGDDFCRTEHAKNVRLSPQKRYRAEGTGDDFCRTEHALKMFKNNSFLAH